MANVSGYAVIEGAVLLALAQQVAKEMSQELRVLVQREKYIEYEVPTSCLKVCDEFMTNGDKTFVVELLERVNVPTINIGTFHKTNPDTNKPMTARKGQVYVTIVLTDLNPETNWFIILEGSHRRSVTFSVAEWNQVGLDIKAGDAVVWQGDLSYLHFSGGGASFMTMVFE